MIQAFDWKKFNELLVKWMVISNQPFTEVECPEFREMIAFLKPFVGEKMVKADQLKNLAMEFAVGARKRLKKYLKVCKNDVRLQRLTRT